MIRTDLKKWLEQKRIKYKRKDKLKGKYRIIKGSRLKRKWEIKYEFYKRTELNDKLIFILVSDLNLLENFLVDQVTEKFIFFLEF